MNDLTAEALGLWQKIELWLVGMAEPWRLSQIAAIAVLFGVAHLFARHVVDAPVDRWMRSLEGLRPIQLRILLVFARRSRAILFVILAWITVGIMRQVTWPSASYLIALAATLVSAWLFVAVVTRLVRNAALRQTLRYGAWAYVTLRILGFDGAVASALDAAALEIGAFRISALGIIKAIGLTLVLVLLAGWVSRFVRARLSSVEDLSPSMRVLGEKTVTLAAYGLAAVVAMQSLGFDLTSLAVLSGAIGVGIGFGLQKVVSNLVSGFILLLDKSIKPGDVISLGDTFGWVQTLGARYVAVNTRDGREYLIPNEDLITGQVVNWSHSSDLVRLDIHFGVSYDSDPHAVRKIACAAIGDVTRVVTAPAPVCHVTGFGDSSVDFVLRFWIKDPSGGLTNVRGAVYLALWDALRANDIDIPFPRRDVAILETSPRDPRPVPEAVRDD